MVKRMRVRRDTRLFDQEPKQTSLVMFELRPEGSKSRSTPAGLLRQETSREPEGVP